MAPYQWARQVNPQDFQRAVTLAQRLSADPVAGLQELIAEIRQNPQHDAAIRSLAARALAQRSQQTGPDLNPIQVQLENGQTVGLYSADQISALRQQWLDQVKQELSPVTKTVDELRAERETLQRQASVERFANATMADLATWPGMESADSKAAVARELAAARIDPNDPREVALALNAAWRKVIAPTLGQQAEAKLLDSLKTKAAASTGVNPGSAAPSAPRTVTKFSQLPAEAWR